MKLLRCRACGDILAMYYRWRRCRCGASRGRYLTDGLHAEIDGLSLALGMRNSDLRNLGPYLDPIAPEFPWWPIAESSDRVRRLKG